MSDMTSVIQPKSDQINADDLIGREITIKITDVKIRGGEEQPVSIAFEGSPKVFRPCKSMSRVMVQAWGPDASKYVGRAMRLYRDPDVKWGGMAVGGIRIRAMSHIEKPISMPLTASKGSRKLFTVQPLKIEEQRPEVDIDEAQNAARAAARKGTDAFREWWTSDAGKPCQSAAKAIMDELKEISTKADAAMDDDPFGLPPTEAETTPTEDDLRRAEEEARSAGGFINQEND